MGANSTADARETSCITSGLLLTYAEHVGGRAAVDAILRRCGLEDREDQLRDENRWFEHSSKLRMFEAAAEVLDDPLVTRHMGERALDLGIADGLKAALRALGTPSLVYRNVVRANAKFNAMHRMDLLGIARDRAQLRFVDVSGSGYHPLDCHYNIGLLSRIPVMFGQPPARILHPECGCAGAEACVYDISWSPHPAYLRLALGSGAAAVAGTAGPLLLAPPLLPAGVALALAVGAASGWRGLSLARARWRQLEHELREQLRHGEQLADSLQDLAGELRLDELLAKVTRNAQAAVGGNQFALLVADEDGVNRCRSSSDLPAATQAALEAWAGEAGELPEPVVIDDLSSVEALLPVSACKSMPLGSLCAAPLVFRGRSLGLLVALATSPQAFLPRDIDLIKSYAVQAAVGLTNARLYETQERLAARDPLTGLLNRRELQSAIMREIERCRRHGRGFSVVLFDLDNFKLINDADGHSAGDGVLRRVADAVAGSCRPSDMAFRLGGDEFALLLPEAEQRVGANAVAERAGEAMSAVDARVGVSHGIATWPDDGGDEDALLMVADRRLYSMKDARWPTYLARTAQHQELSGPAQGERLAVASRLSTRLAPLRDPVQIADTTVTELHRSFGYLRATILRIDPDAVLRSIATAGSETGPHEQPLHEGVNGRVACVGEPALVLDESSELAVPVRVSGRIWGVLNVQSTERNAFDRDDLLLADTVAAQVGSALSLSDLFDRLESTLTNTIAVLSDALEAKDPYTAAHAREVSGLAERVATRIGIVGDELRALRYAALLHDVGKIGVPTEIVSKPGPLTDGEFELIKQHTLIGARMLERIPDLEPVLPLIRSAHERWDGAGYPDGLSGEAIPLGARVICACDALHAMTSDRPYRSAMPMLDAIGELRRCAGTQFDPTVVDALVAEVGSGQARLEPAELG